MSGRRLTTDQHSSGDQVRDIFVTFPDVPKLRSASSLALRNRVDQRNSLPNTRSPTRLLVLATVEVKMMMNNVTPPRGGSTRESLLLRLCSMMFRPHPAASAMRSYSCASPLNCPRQV